jgi:hypothetical protein
MDDEAVANFNDLLIGSSRAPEPNQNEASEDIPETSRVDSRVVNNVVMFPTGALPKNKTRNRLRD